MTKYIVYSTKDCPKCVALKDDLHRKGIEFEDKDMSTAESITELRVGGCFAMSAPVLQIDESFYDVKELFDQGGNVIDRF
jgi:glutaredoxin